MQRVRDDRGHFGPSTHILTGKYGRWSILTIAKPHNGQTYWHCVCECGTERDVAANNLVNGASKSCGCLGRELTSARFKTHGLRDTQEYTLWNSAKQRAKREHATFDLSPEDIKIPEICPLLGIPIRRNSPLSPWSPSVDRIDPFLGYTKRNTWVISFRANVIKNNANPEELRQIADKLEERLCILGTR